MPAAKNLNVSLIGVPMQRGANRPGVELGPNVLRKSRIQLKLESLGYKVRDVGGSSGEPESRTAKRRGEAQAFERGCPG